MTSVHDAVNSASAAETLEALLHLGGDPLFAAYAARLRALDASSDGPDAAPTDDRECAAEFEALRQCVVHAGDVVQIVMRAADVSRVLGASAERRHRRAMQSLDWALRDLFLDRYTLAHRRQYVAATGLFLDLLRRHAATHETMKQTTPETTWEATHVGQSTISKATPSPTTPVHTDRRLNSSRSADALHS